MSSAPNQRACFVSAPLDAQVGPLIRALSQRGWHPRVLTDVAVTGEPVVEILRAAIAQAELVVVVLTATTDSNASVEAGMALAFGKPIVLVVEPGASVPSDLSGALVVQATLEDVDAVAWALEHIQGRLGAHSVPSPKPRRGGLGSDGRALLQRARGAAVTSGQDLEQLVIDTVEASGAAAVRNAGLDRGFDIGVWSDDLESIGGNPLLIEIKQRMSEGAIRQSLLALHSTPSARLALIVYVDPADLGRYPDLRSPLLAIQLETLLERMQDRSFAEVVRDLRNRSVHGLPLS